MKKILSVLIILLIASTVMLTGCAPAATTTATTTASAETTAAETTTAPSTAATTAAPAETTIPAETTAPVATTAATTAAPTVVKTAAKVTGTIVAGGSSALQPLAQKAADLFATANPGASVQVQGGGSGTGLTQVAKGGFNIGNSDLFAEEKLDAATAGTLVDHKVCVVGFATIVNPDVKVDNLTKQQLVDIFTGKILNWKDVGGVSEDIVIIQRPASSGTRATFKKYALGGATEGGKVQSLTSESSGTILKTVHDTPGAISYLALSYLNSSVKALKLDGVEATSANITTGNYPVWSYEHMYTKGEATGVAKAFLDFMMSADFSKYITELGYIPNSAMKVSR